MRALRNRLAPLALLGTLGCGNDFAPPSEIAGLRVLAVHQDPGSGAPGATVKLDMLLADRPDTVTDTVTDPAPDSRVTWLGACHNPPGRQYFACLPQLRQLAQALGPGPIPPDHHGLHFEVPLPDDILSSAPLVAHDSIHFGVSYVFFAVCAGTLGFDPTITEGIPVTCTANFGEPDSKPVGPSGFVVGFTTIYTYEGVDNANPTMTSLDFDGEPMPASTRSMPRPSCKSDDECAGDYRHRRVCTADTHTCAPVIGTCDGDSCPVIRVTPHIDTASVERFTDGYEVMWASYYTSSGEMSYDARLVVDRSAGLAGDPSATWKMPEQPGTSRIWVTVNDQRGGADWAFFDVSVQ